MFNSPGPDRSVRLEQLRTGRARRRRYRNRRIGEFLKELGFTEGRGTGIPKILRAMRQNGSPPPEFEFDEDHSYFMVRLPVHPAAPPRTATRDLDGLVAKGLMRKLGKVGRGTRYEMRRKSAVNRPNRPSSAAQESARNRPKETG